MSNIIPNETIVALSTPPGVGALGVIRVSGKKAFGAVNAIASKDILELKGYQTTFCRLMDDGEILDEVILTVFKNPQSFTGEDVVEISCHGSSYILQRTIELLINKGCRVAQPGEFSLRAYLNGKLDLSQTEAISDLISSGNKASHKLAVQQMRGGYSQKIDQLREKLIHFASLLELELDFSGEDVEFANRPELKALILEIQETIHQLIKSFRMGNAIKTGVPITIVGAPNAGKSTLLNALLQEERAIVSDIEGTTRDTVEDEAVIQDIGFRFIDTAGIRDTTDTIEGLGIERTYSSMQKALVVIWLIDASKMNSKQEFDRQHQLILDRLNTDEQSLLIVANKMDVAQNRNLFPTETIFISAKQGEGIDSIENALVDVVHKMGHHNQDIILTNTRHLHCLQNTNESLNQGLNGMEMELSSDLVAIDIRHALHYLGEITGAISTEDLLGNIFSRFCIGK